MRDVAICLIGNSHIAPWKLAWSSAAPEDREGFSATFFASPEEGLDDLCISGDELVPATEQLQRDLMRTSGGLDRVRCADYDAFVLVAMDLVLKIMLVAWRTFGTLKHRQWVPVAHLVTEECLRTTVNGLLEPVRQIATSIRAVSRAPLIIAPRPFPTEAFMDRAENDHYREARHTGYAGSLADSYRTAIETMAASCGAETLWQDEATLAMPGFTRNEFAQGAQRLLMGTRFPDDNVMHMNEAFGALMLAKLLCRLRSPVLPKADLPPFRVPESVQARG